MIQENDSIRMMINNIYKMAKIIKEDFDKNGEVHYDYILEKYKRLDWDLQLMIDMAEKKKRNDKAEKVDI